jgi:hypothetical protein
MSFLAVLRRKWKYSVENPGPGRLIYREGNREYTFPVYEDDSGTVLVGVPSSQRIHFFFNWYWHPRDFPPAASKRILPRIAEYLRADGSRVRVFSRGEGLEFYAELFACRARASELLEEAGFTWFVDYSAIDLAHEVYGLEIGGIKSERAAGRMRVVLLEGFPHWHHARASLHGGGPDPGWTLSVSMFPSESRASGSYDEL